MMAVGFLAPSRDPGQGGEPVIDLQVERPARDHHLDPERAGIAQGLGDGLQARRVPARPCAERVDLIQDQQRRTARGHPRQHRGRRAWQAQRGPEFVRVAEAVEPVQPGRQHDQRAVITRVRRGPGLEIVQDLAEQGGLAGPCVSGHRNHRRAVGRGEQLRDDPGRRTTDLRQRGAVRDDPVAVTAGLVMNPGVDALVTAPVGGPETAGLTQEIPDIVRRQLHRKMIIEEVPEPRDHVVGRSVYQRLRVRAQGLAQALLVDVSDGDPLEPPPRLLGRDIRPRAAQRLPRCPLVLRRDEPRLELGEAGRHPRVLAQLLQMRRRQRGEELAPRGRVLPQPLAERRDHPAGDQGP